MSQGNLEGLLNCSLEKLKGLVDVNTIIGEPITAPDGTIIVPVSKVAFGYGSGGSDFGGDKPKDLFGGGSGAGVNIQPVAFLVIKDGCVRTIQLSDTSNTIDRALTMLPELVEKLTTLVKKDGKTPAEEPKAE